MPRGLGLDAPDTLDHVIVRGIDRRRIVDDDLDRERFLNRLGELAQETLGRDHLGGRTDPSADALVPIVNNVPTIYPN